MHLVTAISGTAKAARALLDVRIEQTLRLSELAAWRELAVVDPFGELKYCWLDYLTNFTDTHAVTLFNYKRVLRTQLDPAFGRLTIGEIGVRQVENHLAQQMARSVDAAKDSRKVLSLMLGFAVREGVIASNPMNSVGRVDRLRFDGDTADS